MSERTPEEIEKFTEGLINCIRRDAEKRGKMLLEVMLGITPEELAATYVVRHSCGHESTNHCREGEEQGHIDAGSRTPCHACRLGYATDEKGRILKDESGRMLRANAMPSPEPIVFELDGKPRGFVGTDYALTCFDGKPAFEAERDIVRCGDRVTIFLPMCDVTECQTVQEFKCLLANAVTPVLNRLVEEWEKQQREREPRRKALP